MVKDLFYNAPVRRKFLKKPAYETAGITELMARLILSRPDISFRYLADGKNVYFSPGDTAELAVQTGLHYGFFAGWSDGCTQQTRRYAVTADDTLTLYAAEMAHGTLATNTMTTVVTSLGSMANLGDEQVYYVNTSEGGTVFAAGLWLGGIDRTAGDDSLSLAGMRFMLYGHDFCPGPLRLADGGTTTETVLPF